MSTAGADGVSRAGKGFAVKGSRKTEHLRVGVLEGIDSKNLPHDWDIGLIRFQDLAALLEPCESLTILFVDLEALHSKKRTEVIAQVGRANNVRVIALDDQMVAANCEELLRAGFAGILSRHSSRETLLRAIESVGDGQLWFPREIISRVLKGLLIEEDLNRLTSREIEIVRLVGSGLNNQEIADKLFISRETVRWHVRALHAKLGTKDRDSLREYVRYLRSSEPKIPSASVESRRRSVAS